MDIKCRSRDCPICGWYVLTVFRVSGRRDKTTLLMQTSKDIPSLIAEGEKWQNDATRTYYQIREEK